MPPLGAARPDRRTRRTRYRGAGRPARGIAAGHRGAHRRPDRRRTHRPRHPLGPLRRRRRPGRLHRTRAAAAARGTALPGCAGSSTWSTSAAATCAPCSSRAAPRPRRSGPGGPVPDAAERVPPRPLPGTWRSNAPRPTSSCAAGSPRSCPPTASPPRSPTAGERATWRRSPGPAGTARRSRLSGGPRAVGDRWHARPRAAHGTPLRRPARRAQLVLTGREELPPRAGGPRTSPRTARWAASCARWPNWPPRESNSKPSPFRWTRRRRSPRFSPTSGCGSARSAE
ncbi:hypothetical protein LV779_39160 [Streptomyces thinghirensis]|nr:hypothetical protein [Streptomyces thinghirensis]